MGGKHTAYHIINSDPGHTRLKQQLDKILRMTFTNLSRKSDEKEKKKKLEWQLQSFLRFTQTQQVNVCVNEPIKTDELIKLANQSIQ